ncbi:hypothetical protein JX265_010692 [Neoarthrinium moseri]|uniref:Uncharacterized protein n=1 Tax=Neoarthrinium moseri TaxID=1658444 RepID=A0A9Q0AI62_9PEZI|nr:hypothetical protein JX265_010692 [Neoarthrinium moseri]
MASFVDLSSSPDPLGDEAPSSMRPSTRRIARHFHPQAQSSSLKVPPSTSTKVMSTSKSPRKQTFELDVGNGRSPQRLLVTVEAEDDRGRDSGVSRRLFAASPSRSVSRRRQAATTTTTVPLRGLTDDEGGDLGDDPTPRRRGRPRGSLGSKNGTPAPPRGKKRAGTPIRKAPTAKRRSGEASSEAALPSDVLLDTDANSTADPTPKAKTRARKTPKKAGTPAPPSSKPTGRKRGRPRKALMPDEVAILTSEAEFRADETDMLPNEDAPTFGDAGSEGETHMDENDRRPEDEPTHGDERASASSPTRENTALGLSVHAEEHHSPGPAPSSDPIDGASAHEARAGGSDGPMFDDYLQEPQSDFESEAGDEDGMTYSGQDNLTHASDFSMIAVESLPSFQASFQGNLSGIAEEEHSYADAGEETNLLINQTMESLRRSTQTESQDEPEATLAHENRLQNLSVMQNHSMAAQSSPADLQSSQMSFSRSPRRPKAMPLNRQIFAPKAPHVDDSFSSIPDSVLHAATPARISTKQVSMETAHEDTVMYDDSFSEIPDEILVAATPKPAARSAAFAYRENNSDQLSSDVEGNSASRSTNIGSDRLPTPDDTNSSTTDAKNGAGEETQGMAAISSAVRNTSNLNIRSSPPTISRHFTTMNIESEGGQVEQDTAGTPPRRSSSPAVSQIASGSPGQSKTLEPPAPQRRPTLSPIVRAGRTLQNIMTDRSSPDGRESSLGSPFRGSVQNDSRQSSISKSPIRDPQHSTHQSNLNFGFNPLASLSQSIRSAFASSQRHAPAPTFGQAEDPFGPSMHRDQQTEAPRTSPRGTEHNETETLPVQEEPFPSMTSSTRAAPASEGEVNWAGDQSSPTAQRSRRMSATLRSVNSSLVGTRGSNSGRVVNVENAEEEEEVEEEQQPEEQEEGLSPGDIDEYDQLDAEIEKPEEPEEPDEQEDEQPEDQLVGGPQEEEEEGFDDLDLWEAEASRATPTTPRSTKILRAEAEARRQPSSQVQPQEQEQEPASEPAQVSSNPARRAKIPSPWRRNTRRLIYQDDFKSASQIEMEDSPPSEVDRPSPVPPVAVQQERQYVEPEADVEDMRHDDIEEEFRDQRSDSDDGADGGEFDLPQEHSPTPEPYRNVESAPEPSLLEEYSMVSKHDHNTGPPAQEQPAPARRSFFGSFDILSFFSSPRPPVAKEQVEETPEHQTTSKVLPRPLRSVERQPPSEPQSALRATGFFPSIRQKAFNPSPERRNDLFSPGSALKSNDTVPDSTADLPSTPERQDFPPIPQKRNFTPLSAQSRNTASLFTPSRQGSTPAQDTRTPSPESDPPQELYDSGEGSSMQTDEPSFERIPPREKPSHWDKTLSPSKSCLRSPLKPKTPGRVVEFTSSVLNPDARLQARDDQQRALSTLDGGINRLISQAPVLTAVPRVSELDKENSPSPPPRSPDKRAPAGAPLAPKPALSATAWTKHHWLRLDELLELRAFDPLRFQMLYPRVLAAGGVDPDTKQHPLAGKEVSTARQSLTLLPWHLEVVEAFRADVPGWDARSLSKRLFALIIGKQNRQMGQVGRTSARAQTQAQGEREQRRGGGRVAFAAN